MLTTLDSVTLFFRVVEAPWKRYEMVAPDHALRCTNLKFELDLSTFRRVLEAINTAAAATRSSDF
jgi:hypothetical protein